MWPNLFGCCPVLAEQGLLVPIELLPSGRGVNPDVEVFASGVYSPDGDEGFSSGHALTDGEWQCCLERCWCDDVTARGPWSSSNLAGN